MWPIVGYQYHFGPLLFFLHFYRRQIERVSHFKILGLQLSDNLLWIGMSNTYVAKSHPSYISSNSLSGLAYQQTTCSTFILQ